jgi:hypothetical protein
MLKPSRLRSVAFVSLLMIALAACGQHAGVHPTTDALVAAGGGTLPPGQTPAPGTVPSGVGTTGGGSGPGVGGGGGGTGAGGGGGTGVAGPGDRTGITATTITIGLHAPLTGAAPIQPKSFQIGKDLYWKWLKSKGEKLFGRDVEVAFADDHYNPTQAVAVCNQMATQQQAFLLIGGAGTDQINACAAYAEPRGIPYLSPGVQEAGLSARTTYFAVSETYKAQMPQLVSMLQALNKKQSLDKWSTGGLNQGDSKITVGHVRPNTPNFNDAASSLRQAVTAAGWQYKEYTVQKEGSSSDAQSVATSAKGDGVDILVPITAPTFTVQLAIQSDTASYTPQWAGIAITDNVNQFLDSVESCGKRNSTSSTVQNARFFSPWPGWKQVQQGKYDPEFSKAAAKFAPTINTRSAGGDLMLALWGIMKAFHQVMLKAGPNVSRQSFITTMKTLSLSTGMFPDLHYSGGPFGAKGVHVLVAHCNEPADANANVQGGAQFVDEPLFPGLRTTF